jgi:hypothetical protein
MYAQVQVTTAASEDAVLVPLGALVQQGASTVVFVVSEGKASARPVQVGIQDGANAQIVAGLSAGESVVTTGQTTLRDGQSVQQPGQALGALGALGQGRGAGTPAARRPAP